MNGTDKMDGANAAGNSTQAVTPRPMLRVMASYLIETVE
jgi:hypothetical protein